MIEPHITYKSHKLLYLASFGVVCIVLYYIFTAITADASDESRLEEIAIPHTQLTICRDVVATTLSKLPVGLLSQLEFSISFGATRSHAYENQISINCAQSVPKITYDITHELGHVVYNQILSESEKSLFATTLPTYDQYGHPNYVTEYATTSPAEDFADTFMVFMINRNDLQQNTRPSPVLTSKFDVVLNHIGA